MAATLAELAGIFDRGAYPALVKPIIGERAQSELGQSCIEAFNVGLKQFGEFRPEPTKKGTEKSGFFLPDAFSNPQHMRYALKTTAAAMLCYLTYSLLSWRGIHTCLITCYIVSLTTVAETVEKLTLRIIGCLIGAGLGLAVLLTILPKATNIGNLAVIVFLGIFLAAWTAAGSPRISYAGYQVAFAFLLVVVQGDAPAFDLKVARDRVIGILVGNLVSYLASSYIWPASIAPRIDALLEKARRQLSTVARTNDQWQMRRMTADTHGLLATIEEDIQLVAYEPRALRPRARWLHNRLQAVGSAQRLGSPLLVAAELGRSQAMETGLRILDGDFFDKPIATPQFETDFQGPTLRELLERRCRAVKETLGKVTRGGNHA
jgi:multidrug resistance protein MdtO